MATKKQGTEEELALLTAEAMLNTWPLFLNIVLLLQTNRWFVYMGSILFGVRFAEHLIISHHGRFIFAGDFLPRNSFRRRKLFLVQLDPRAHQRHSKIISPGIGAVNNIMVFQCI